jgi:DNA-binding NarL/FixJ family response regulator
VYVSTEERRQSLRVLFIDEHALRRAAFRQFLQTWGQECGISVEISDAGSLQDAEIPLRSAQIVLLGTGSIHESASLLSELKQMSPDLPVAVLADQDSTSDVLMALERGAQAFITTRIDPALMLHALQFVAAGGHFFPPKVLMGGNEDLEHHSFTDSTTVQTAAAMQARRDGKLTARQNEVLKLLQEGHSNKRMARVLGLSESTVKVHVRLIMRRLGVSNRTQAALRSVNLPADGVDPEVGEPRAMMALHGIRERELTP